jgi:hypothetical protein
LEPQAELHSQALLQSKAETQAVTVRSTEWVDNVSFLLPANGIPAPELKTAVVTFAGKKNPEYIDGAVMLAMSVKQHLPRMHMAAMIITGMKQDKQRLLRDAGWKTIVVPNWDAEYCGEGCDQEFLGRWHDSFEKINCFRLPFEKVLFLDSDTYIFSPRIHTLLHTLELPEGHIAMARDGCKDEYNSGVMIYRPGVAVFTEMLRMVTQRTREQVLDQNLINSYYTDKVVEIDREYNCVDTVGIQPGLLKACEHHCINNAVIAHFTGHPKPTSPKRRLLELVRRPGSPKLACMHTNFGACGKWSEFYCDTRKYSSKLSPALQAELRNTGKCCHSPFKPGRDAESCLECPATMKLSTARDKQGRITGTWGKTDGYFMKTNIHSGKVNGGRPIYINRNSDMKNAPVFLYFVQAHLVWAVGDDFKGANAYGYAGLEAQCPRDSGYWSFWNGTGFVRKHYTVQKAKNWRTPPEDTDHIVWDLKRNVWRREVVTWEHGEGPEMAHASESDEAVSGNATDDMTSDNMTSDNETESGGEDRSVAARAQRKKVLSSLETAAARDAWEAGPFPDVAVCMTTLPGHLTSKKGFAALRESLSSVLIKQTYGGNVTGYLAVPSQSSVREGAEYPENEIQKLISMMNGKLVVVPIERDVGPGSRYLGCAKMVKDPDTLVVAFGDIAYRSKTISALSCAKHHDPEFSWTGHRFIGLTGVQTGQGADGFMMRASDLDGFEDFMESVEEPCSKFDDLAVSEWLTNHAKRPVKSLEDRQDYNADVCGLVTMPIYKANCWTVEDTHNKKTSKRQICRPTVTSFNSLRGYKATSGHAEDMKRCADALAAKREEKNSTESSATDEIAAGIE